MASLPKSNSSRRPLSEVWAEIVEKCWNDEKFKKRVIGNPMQILKEHGYEGGERIKYVVVEEKGSDLKVYLSLPQKREPKELQDEDLRDISAGNGGQRAG